MDLQTHGVHARTPGFVVPRLQRLLPQGSAASQNLGVPYSRLINALSTKNIILDRKILSDLAINDTSTFEKIVKTASK